MKRKNITVLITILVLFILCGCSKMNYTHKDPDISQIRNVAKLSTLKCYYHNVAKSKKTKGTGITGIGEKDRKFWVEYTGIVTLGIDMSKVEMEINGNEITIVLPPAKVLEISINEESWNSDSYICSEDGINKNKINSEDVTFAINEAQDNMKKTAENNATMLNSAQMRAKTLIENYINQLGTITGVEYSMNWKYLNADE